MPRIQQQPSRSLTRHAAEPTIVRQQPSVAALDQAESAQPSQDSSQVTVISGANIQNFPLAGLTLGHARALVEPLVAIHPDAPSLVNGRPVDRDYTLQPGDTLEFVHHAGEKGHGSWTKA